VSDETTGRAAGPRAGRTQGTRAADGQAPDDGRRSLVEVSMDAGVARLRLADPRHRNALSKRLSDDLAAAVDSVLASDARAIVLTAEPPRFLRRRLAGRPA
jgi:hypothetical protein